MTKSDPSTLLQQLRIERAPPMVHRRSWTRWLWGAGLMVVMIALTTVLFHRGTDTPARQVSVTLPPVARTPRPRGSLLDASGYVVARHRATVASKVTGKVVEVNLEEGQHVERGQIIARLDDSNARAQLMHSEALMHQAAAVAAGALRAYEDALPVFQRSESMRGSAVISAQSFDQAKAQLDAVNTELLIAQSGLESARAACVMAQRNLDDMTIRAPFSGIVTEKAAQPGEMVSPVSAGSGFTRTGIGTIVDMSSLEVEVDVNENFIGRVHSQQGVEVILNAFPEWRIPGAVVAIIPTADRAKATVKVRIAILLQDARILPDMGARVSFLRSPVGK